MQRLTLTLLLLPALAACGGQPKCDVEEPCSATTPTGDTGDTGDTIPDGYDRVAFDNEGEACAFGDLTEGGYGYTTAQTTFDGASALVQVVFQDCAQSCATNLSTACSAEVVGQEVVVTGTASYEVPTTPGTCTDACNVVMAQCAVDLPSGSYTLTYGGESSESFDVPGTSLPPCATTP